MHGVIENSPVSCARFQPLEQPEDTVRHFYFQDHFQTEHGLPFHTVREYLPAGSHTGWHCHDDFYVLTVIRSGHGTSIINNQMYPILRGDVFIIALGSSHCVRDYQDIELDAFYFSNRAFYTCRALGIAAKQRFLEFVAIGWQRFQK